MELGTLETKAQKPGPLSDSLHIIFFQSSSFFSLWRVSFAFLCTRQLRAVPQYWSLIYCNLGDQERHLTVSAPIRIFQRSDFYWFSSGQCLLDLIQLAIACGIKQRTFSYYLCPPMWLGLVKSSESVFVS